MPSGARLRFVLLSSVQGRRWHAPTFGLIFIAIFLWLNNRHSLWAQPPAPPLLLISEVHPDAAAVGDEVGEWT